MNSCLVALTEAWEKCFIVFGEKVVLITVTFLSVSILNYEVAWDPIETRSNGKSWDSVA